MTKHSTPIDPDKIQILQISIYKSNIDASIEFLEQGAIPERYAFSFSQNTGFDYDQNLISIRLNILLNSKDENNKKLELKGEFGIEFQFRVENMKDFAEAKENGNIVFDSILGITMMGIAYSTARGIILQRTEGTLLSGVILPVIDPAELLQ